MISKSLKRTLVSLAILAVLLAVAMPSVISQEVQQNPPPQQNPPRDDAPEPDEGMLMIKTGVSFINILLIVLLLFLYVDIYRKVHSEFTFGLILLMIVLLMYAISSNPALHRTFGYRGAGLGPFLILPDVFTTVALIVLLRLSNK